MDSQSYKVLVFSLWIILPILPAFILYKFLPKNTVVVKGPFKGLTVDMAGAFAGYFLLFLTSYLIIKKMMFELPDKLEPPNRKEVWKVNVNVIDENGAPIDVARNRPGVAFDPEAGIKNGVFKFDLAVKVENGSYDFPGISFSAYSDTARLFISGESDNDLFDPDIVRSAGNKVQTKGHWEYDFERKILTYTRVVRLIKDGPRTKTADSNFQLDSMPRPQTFLNGND